MAQQPQFTPEMFNSFIKQMKAIQTASSGNRAGEEDQLQQKYVAAKTVAEEAPSGVAKAFRDLFVFQKGEGAYATHMDDKYHAEAQQMITTFKGRMQQMNAALDTDMAAYVAAVGYFVGLVPAFRQYHKETVALAEDIRQNTSDLATNNRRVEYDFDGISSQGTIKWVCIVVYAVMCLIYIISVFSAGGGIGGKVGKSVVAILFPFIVLSVIKWGVSTWWWFVGLLPYNASIEFAAPAVQ